MPASATSVPEAIDYRDSEEAPDVDASSSAPSVMASSPTPLAAPSAAPLAATAVFMPASATSVPEAIDYRDSREAPDVKECSLAGINMVLPVLLEGQYYDYLSLLRMARNQDVEVKIKMHESYFHPNLPNSQMIPITFVCRGVRTDGTGYYLESPFTRKPMVFRPTDYELSSDVHLHALQSLNPGGVSLAALFMAISDSDYDISDHRNIDSLVLSFVFKRLPDWALTRYVNNIDPEHEKGIFTVKSETSGHYILLYSPGG